VDRQGNLIAFGDISRVLKRENLAYLSEVNQFVKGGETHTGADVSEGIQGNQVVTSHVDLGEPDWAVVIEMPVAEAYADFMNEIVLMVAATALSLLAAVLGGIYLSRRIAKPIKALRDAVLDIGTGKLDTNINISSKNE
jgi:methyl-accepting chemotaxis protein